MDSVADFCAQTGVLARQAKTISDSVFVIFMLTSFVASQKKKGIRLP